MTQIVTVTDIPQKVQDSTEIALLAAMVDGANAKASRIAPCLADATSPPSDEQMSEARLVLIGAITRWTEAGSGALQTQSAGPFAQSIDTRQRTGYNLWPSEIEQLQAICRGESTQRRVFSVDTAPAESAHLPWCSLAFGALYCSCGVDIAGYPIYEGI